MTTTTYTSRHFNQDVSSAKKAAETGPVYITVRGKPAHVLITYDEFIRLSGHRRTLTDALSMPEGQDIEFDTVRAVISDRDVDL
ncbi:type II toxin-antitoxin system prevent-host-death family antitoxin [Erwiniaceae bacterium BAC15a-03b]|uniref:Antitoxin n=1 Tax=Winslowiella arboricola TaxID=2978220 RepID=A0A9J6PQP3_9GAMM|nr:type II toxin-antitoxin system prevent-host-death family antitoxin [Winslowiella arboricola]MCU5774609.1 type II toxin-antitoxin system prevent-host-death family antitoxin [Winslowiella arboricola]MCU5777981.1 type II toxin-antitoxin system prevent-host-death family antitoxin [Winslowiella arboricola]